MRLRPAGLGHVVKQAGPGDRHLTPSQVLVQDDLAQRFVRRHWLQKEGLVGLGKGESVLGDGLVEPLVGTTIYDKTKAVACRTMCKMPMFFIKNLI